MIANFGGQIAIQGNYSVTGSSPYHIVAGGGNISADSGSPIVVTVSGAPQANDDSYGVGEGQTLTVTAAAGVLNNDTDTGSTAPVVARV